MNWNRKMTALLLAVVTAVFLAAGCGVGGNPAEPQNGAIMSSVPQAPIAPQNLKAAVKERKVTLEWDASPGATGYVIALYDAARRQYVEVGTSAETKFTYTEADSGQTELKFGVYAYTEAGEQRLYSPEISKVTAKIAVEKITLSQKKLTVQVGGTETLKATVTPENDAVGILWESADSSVATVNGDGVVTGKAVGETTVTATTTNGTKTACAVTVVEKTTVPSGKLIAFTFDDGPHYQYTKKLLNALKKHNAKATFFMVGQNVAGNEDLVQRMKDEGHELGNHSWDHASLTNISKSKMREEIDKTNNAVYEACGSYPTVFRAPYGNLNDAILDYLTVPSIYWSVDTRDWETPKTSYVKKQILNNAYDGAIMLLHDIHKTSVDGFIAALDELEKEGYTLVTVTELLSRRGASPQAGVTYYDAAA